MASAPTASAESLDVMNSGGRGRRPGLSQEVRPTATPPENRLVGRPSGHQTDRRLSRRQLLVEVGAPVVGGLLALSIAPAALATTGASEAVSVAPFAQAAPRPLTPTFYQWIIDLHPSVPQVNDAFKATAPLNFQIAPVQGFGIDRF